jgi:hypothetical protein
MLGTHGPRRLTRASAFAVAALTASTIPLVSAANASACSQPSSVQGKQVSYAYKHGWHHHHHHWWAQKQDQNVQPQSAQQPQQSTQSSSQQPCHH